MIKIPITKLTIDMDILMKHLVQHIILGRLVVSEQHLELLPLARLGHRHHLGYLLLTFLLLLRVLVVLLEGPIQAGARAHVEHAATEDQESTVEAEIRDQVLDQHGKDEATGRRTRHTDAVRQRAMGVEVLRDEDYPRCRGETAPDTCVYDVKR